MYLAEEGLMVAVRTVSKKASISPTIVVESFLRIEKAYFCRPDSSGSISKKGVQAISI